MLVCLALQSAQQRQHCDSMQALQVKVAKSVEVARRYRRVLWYSLFVAVYLVVLYLQVGPDPVQVCFWLLWYLHVLLQVQV